MLEAGPRGRGSVPCVLARSWLRRPCRAVCWLRGVYSLALRGAGLGRGRIKGRTKTSTPAPGSRRDPRPRGFGGRRALSGPSPAAVPRCSDVARYGSSSVTARATTGNPQRRTRPVRGSSRRVGLCSGLCVCAQTLWGHGTMARCPRARQRDTGRIPVPLGTISDAHERPNALGCWPWPFLSQRAPMHAISDRLHSLLDRTPRASPDQRAPRRLGR